MDALPEKGPAPRRAIDYMEENDRAATCEIHGDYTAKDLVLFGRTHMGRCPECVKEAAAIEDAARKIREAEDAQRRMEARLDRAGIPQRFRSKTFDSYVADTEGKEKALTIARDFAEQFDNHYRRGTVVVFSGLPGTGKSHLATAIAQAIMPGHTAMYTSAIDAIRMVRNTWRRDSEQSETDVLNMLAALHLLVLDEVGVQHGTESEQVTLFDIINRRYSDMKPTILLTNLNRKGLMEFLGERSFDRLREGGIWVTFDWKSQRSEQKPELIERRASERRNESTAGRDWT